LEGRSPPRKPTRVYSVLLLCFPLVICSNTSRAWFRNENSQIEGLMNSDQGLRPEEYHPPPAPQLPLAPQPPPERPPAAIAQDHPPPSRVMAGGERGERTRMGRGADLWRGRRRAVVGGRRWSEDGVGRGLAYLCWPPLPSSPARARGRQVD
jgi:hypothetical protein